ncbi:MAG: glycoside hydrolase family 99-like domain-containing protein [Verrucomicrobiota bacterium]
MKPRPAIFQHAHVAIEMALLVCSCLTTSAQTTNRFFDFVQNQSERRYSEVPREVLAFYYGWYRPSGERNSWGTVDTSRQTISKTARYPVKGGYSSHDREVVAWQIDQAKAHGITGFIISWWGTGEWESWHNESLDLLMNLAEEKNFKVSIYWEQAPGTGQHQVNRAVDELSHVLKQHGQSKAFLKVDGKPVVFAYNRVTMFQVPAASWPDIIEGVRKNAGDFVLIADGYQAGWAYLFDGIHSYGLTGVPQEIERRLQPDKLDSLRNWLGEWYAGGVKLARQRNRISCLVVIPGVDSRKAYGFDWEMNRLDGQTYLIQWQEAVKANPDWILITSWNEWPEGTEVEPSLELGDRYLQLTAEYAQPFLASKPVAARLPATTATRVPGRTNELKTVFAGRRIAMLTQDQVGDAEFWAAYCGANLQRVDWRDLIDPRVFNASNYPVLIHIGGEHYTSSVKTVDDVTRTLARYLHQGGFLVSLPTGTWPLLYDDSRKGVPHGITDTLALGIDNGFEQPPIGTKLVFHAKTNVLFGLSATAPFPSAGDLRWRPANRSRVPATDAYTPLIQLKDGTGKLQGDAVAYVEHRTSSLAGGKTIYVWMRTAESFGPDVFLPALYQFTSTRLKPLPANP